MQLIHPVKYLYTQLHPRLFALQGTASGMSFESCFQSTSTFHANPYANSCLSHLVKEGGLMEMLTEEAVVDVRQLKK